MTIELKMPALSPTMEEGTLAKWLVKEGDQVSSGDLLAEIETDKATMEFEAVDEGTIAKILVPEGTDGVKVGAPIAILAGEGEDVSAPPSPSPPAGEGQAGAASQGEGTAPKLAEAARPTPSAPSPPAAVAAPPSPARGEGPARIKASPLARRLAEAQGIDLGSLKGSGPGGRIVRADLGTAIAAPVSRTSMPRTTASVELMATARTWLRPMCCCTSATTRTSWPDSVMALISSAL